MPDCCKSAVRPEDVLAACGQCLTTGRRVAPATVKALLTPLALSQFEPGGDYRLCSNAGCDVVYFADRAPTFFTRDVRARVWQKEPCGRRVICYCFGENEGDIADEVARTSRSRAVDRVRGHIHAGRCACDVHNPAGVCCLGDVQAAVERMQQTLREKR